MTRTNVCIQGLGFVGAAMAVAVADARSDQGAPLFQVTGVDLDSPGGRQRIAALNAGRFPFGAEDPSLQQAVDRAKQAGNLSATRNPQAYGDADVVVVDIHFDIDLDTGAADLSPLKAAVTTIGKRIQQDCLVIIETTVPPGTCEKVVLPTLRECFAERGLDSDKVLLAHSYERVMPGRDYLSSIVNYWRVYAGCSTPAAEACERFLSQVINTRDYPLTRLSNTTASETAKVLENSYRAVNIAFMNEWGRFAEQVGIDMFEILGAVRMRPTHSNIRQPGFGVGGYCLTKDPLLAPFGAAALLGAEDLTFPFSKLAVEVNAAMPRNTLALLEAEVGRLHGTRVLLLGVSYREDVSDTRYSPSETFVSAAEEQGAVVVCHDPLVPYWPETQRATDTDITQCPDVDAVVFAVRHQQYRTIDPGEWLHGRTPLVIDANSVLDPSQVASFQAAGCRVVAVGRGSTSDKSNKGTACA